MNYLNSFLKDICDERSLWIDRPSNKALKEMMCSLPNIRPSILDFSGPEIIIGSGRDLPENEKIKIHSHLKTLIPWRKGPFRLFDIPLNAEWKSDYKWDRIKSALPCLKHKTILDIGCNNGYFMFKMAHESPKMVLGIDPALGCQLQFKLFQHFAKVPNLNFELLGIEHIKSFNSLFDFVFSMGIIYHHRNPIEQLLDIRESLKPGGHLILETIGIPGEDPYSLFPEDRYAGMRNVWFMPTLSCFINWVKKAKFDNIEVISDTWENKNEQRLTMWCPPPHQSLENFLDRKDNSKTIEGYPAPRRFCLLARKRV